jgi:alanyl aminopeptidase
MVRAMRPSLALALTLAACRAGAPPPAAPSPGPTKPAAKSVAAPARPAHTTPAPPDLRLPTNVRPTRNAVELTIDPTTEDFTGSITTSLEVTTPTDVIWLNADELTVATATVTQRGVAQPATATTPKPGYLALALPHALAAGPATLAITYRGKMHKNDGDGIYTALEAGAWYAFTQFESTDARQAFPTFDEPSYKVPWQLTLHTKADLVALANTPITAERPEAGGMKATVFAETPPLPSYLVAFAVGPFEALPAGKTPGGAPIRIVFPRGRAADAAYPAKITAELVARLEAYFGTPYPYAKLDLLAVSVFNASAMENPGLITFRQPLLLTKPAELTVQRQEAFAITAAHELAHQWFGDLVTLGWWDDTWLNESFASWMEAKVVAPWQPAWDLDIDAVVGRSRVMQEDSLDSARAIRQPIVTAGDINSAFDGITYGKGEAVLRMLERWIGPETFQRGVRAYLAAHAGGNATYDDFVGAMSKAAGKDLTPLFDGFVKQSGLPEVTVDLTCAKGKPPTLTLAQRRYAPTGSKIDPQRTWSLPICVRWGAGKATGRDCTLLTTATGELPLSAKACPTWVLPNEAELGYYRLRLQPGVLQPLLAHAQAALTVGERVGLIGDLSAMVAAGALPRSAALATVGELAHDKSRHLVDASLALVTGLDELVSDALRPNYQRFLRKLYQPRARELGWQPRPGEGPDTKQLRPELLELVAGDGEDRQLIDAGTKLAWAWLDRHDALAPELVNTALAVAARYGDQRLFDRLHADAKRATDRAEQGRLLRALGAFTAPALVEQALALTLSDEFELRESSALLQGAMADPRSRMTAYRFVQQHFDELSAKLPPLYRPYMAMFIVPLCDEAQRADAEAFLTPKMAGLPGGPLALKQALEELSLCAAGRKVQAPSIEAFLRKQ